MSYISSCPVELQLKLEGGDRILALPKTVLLNGEVVSTGEVTCTLGKDCYGDGHLRLFCDYYRALERGEKFAIDGREAAKVMRVILRAYQSHGKVLPL